MLFTVALQLELCLERHPGADPGSGEEGEPKDGPENRQLNSELDLPCKQFGCCSRDP